MSSHVLLIIASLFMSGELSYGAEPDYTGPDLSPLRGGHVPSNTKAYQRRIPVEPPAEKVAIFCKNSAYPNGILCDIRSYYESKWKNRSLNIYEVVIENPHHENGNVVCVVNFEKEQAEEDPLLHLPYLRFSCPSLNDSELPVFQLTEAANLIIKLYDMNCRIIFKNNGRVTKSLPEGRSVSVVEFEHQLYTCPYAAVEGRPTNKRSCLYDGRRCRPVSE